MNDMQYDSQLLAWLDALVNETITPADHEQLQARLREDPQARQAYFAYIDLHLGLTKLATKQRPETQLPAIEFPRLPDRRVHLRQRAWMAIAAAVLLCAIGSWAYWNRVATAPDTAPAPVAARLIQNRGAAFFADAIPALGEELPGHHEYSLVEGAIELEFRQGARAILESPAIFVITDENRLLVNLGNCSVYAPPGAEGFVVETPATRVVDRGTRFSVSVGETGVTDVQVVEGAADVAPSAAVSLPEHLRQLRQGEAVRYGFSTGSSSLPEPLDYDGGKYRATLPDRVVSYRATDGENDSPAGDLVDVTVQRGGQFYTYHVGDLIGIELIHFRANQNPHNLAVEPGYAGPREATLSGDRSLHTGPLNPGGARRPLTTSPVIPGPDDDPELGTPGLGIRFVRPVVNDVGPDVVFFELQTTVDPYQGDAIHVSPLRFAAGLKSHTIHEYDITLTSPEAQMLPPFDLYRFEPMPRSLSEFRLGPAENRRSHLRFRALAVGIDLSDLGYAAGAEVDGLFIQDAALDGHQVDPVFIAGLPPIAEQPPAEGTSNP